MEKVWKSSFKYFNNRSNSGVITKLFQSSLSNLQILSRLSFRLCSRRSSYFERQDFNIFNNSKGIASNSSGSFLLQKSSYLLKTFLTNHAIPLSNVILQCYSIHPLLQIPFIDDFLPHFLDLLLVKTHLGFGEKSNSKSGYS